MFKALFMIMPLFILFVFVIVIALFLSPKLRGKFLSNQVKATKYMVDSSKEDLRYINTNMAQARSEGVKITTKAIKDGFKDTIYCKYCGSEIDKDSVFCKNCGKEQ